MPIQVLNVPQFGFDEANPLLTGMHKGAAIGNQISDYLSKALAREQSRQKLPVELAYTSAQTNQINKMLPIEMALKQAQTGLYGAESQQAAANAKKMTALVNYLLGGGQDASGALGSSSTSGITNTPNQGTQETPGQPSMAPQTNPNATYGIEAPKPSKEDMANKVFFGIDSFGPKQQVYTQKVEQQNKDFLAKAIQYNQEYQDSTNQVQLMNKLNYHLDQAPESGVIGGHLPAISSNAQMAENIISEFSKSGLASVRNAMDSARFSNLDTNIALKLKPQRTWNKGAREQYTDFLKSVQNRLGQRAQFYNYLRGNPQLGADTATADALWSMYQEQMPVTIQKKGGGYEFNNKSKWQEYASPQAIQEVKQKGYYSSVKQEHITDDNIKDTMKQTGMSKKEVLKRLKEKGYDLSEVGE